MRARNGGLLAVFLVAVANAPNGVLGFSSMQKQSMTARPVMPSLSSTAVEMSSVAADSGSEDPALRGGDSGGKATIPNLTISLVKGIVGAGVLSLPSGIAAFGDAPSALLPAMVLIAMIGGMSAYSYSLLGRTASHSQSATFSETWDQSVGSSSAWIPAAVGTVDSFITNMAYSMILADTFCALIKTIGYQSITRNQTLLGVTGLFLLPLCMLKNLSSLAPFSFLGSAGMMYTSLVMAFRYFGKGYALPGGKFLADLGTKPLFGARGFKAAFSPNVFILVCMLSTAFNAHFNAPKFYSELENNTVERFNQVVFPSFGVAMSIFGFIAGMGFLTFGKASNGFILNNYSTADTLMGVSRLAVALSILFSYPILFSGTLDGFLDLVRVPKKQRTDGVRKSVTVGLLAVLTVLASKFTNLGVIISILGATLGNTLVYIFPSVMFRSSVKKMGDKATPSMQREAKLVLAAIAMGVGFGAVGVRMAMLGLA